MANKIPILRTLMKECRLAARQEDNVAILFLADEVLVMLDRGEEYIEFRKQGTSPAPN